MTDLIRSYLFARQVDNLSPKSITAYRAPLMNFADFMAPRPLTEAKRRDVRAWLVSLQAIDTDLPPEAPCLCGRSEHRVEEHALAQATLRLWFTALRKFYNWVIAEDDDDDVPGAGVMMRNPTDNIPVPKIDEDIPTPTLTVRQYRELLAVPGTSFLARRDCALFHVMIDSGMRRGEVQRMRLESIDLDTGAVYIVGKRTDRAARTRVGQLGIKSRQAVDRYLRARDKRPYAAQTDALWLSSWGNGVLTHSGFQSIFERHSERIGMKVHPHMLRHTFASDFRKAGGSEGDLLVLGGWSNRAMLDRYGKADAADRAREAYKKLSIVDKMR